MQEQIELLKDSYKGEDIRKIALSMSNGLTFVEVSDIILLEADGAYTQFYLKDGQKILVSKKLKFYEDILSNRPFFFRTHRSYFVNVNYIKNIVEAKMPILMDNDLSVTISRDRKQEFDSLLKELRCFYLVTIRELFFTVREFCQFKTLRFDDFRKNYFL